MNVEMIDTASALEAFIADLPEPTARPGLYVDLEGNDLSRHGTLSLVTILVEPRHTVHLIDVKTLGSAAFTTSASNGKTVQQILESESIIKVFFDIRNDSDALSSLFGVRVAGIEDIQLMEVASRNSSKRLLNGLAKCIERDAPITFSDKREWRATKDEGHRLFDPARGGSFAVFDERPLTPAMQNYCAQDVLHMPGLRDAYKAKLGDAWWAKIQQETTARIALSQSATFNGNGRHMAEAPAGWQSWRPGNDSQDDEVGKADQPDPQVGEAAIAASSMPDCEYSSSDGDTGRFNYEVDYVSEREDDEYRDYTACDIECGYCGECRY